MFQVSGVHYTPLITLKPNNPEAVMRELAVGLSYGDTAALKALIDSTKAATTRPTTGATPPRFLRPTTLKP